MTDAKPESYWTERNALVTAAQAAGRLHVTGQAPYTEQDPDTRSAYRASLDALKAFDDANGGTPIL